MPSTDGQGCFNFECHFHDDTFTFNCCRGETESAFPNCEFRITHLYEGEKGEKMNFDEWLKKKYPGVDLSPWQEQAVREFLFAAYPDRARAMGMSFCLKVLSEFTCEHGTDFEL